jgi:transposase
MHYPITFRRKVLAQIEEGMSKRDAARLFKISPQTLYNWLSRDDLKPSLSKRRHRKIDKVELRAHVKAHPQMLLRERAKIFGISVPGLSIALKTMKIVKKTKDGMWSETL